MGLSQSINAAADAVNPEETSSLWLPRQGQWSLQMGKIAGIDVGNNVAHVALNGSDATAYGVRYIHAYGPDHTPDVGHTSWGFYNGKFMLLLGRQLVPNGPVSLT